jgi:hypothetical protein
MHDSNIWLKTTSLNDNCVPCCVTPVRLDLSIVRQGRKPCWKQGHLMTSTPSMNPEPKHYTSSIKAAHLAACLQYHFTLRCKAGQEALLEEEPPDNSHPQNMNP